MPKGVPTIGSKKKLTDPDPIDPPIVEDVTQAGPLNAEAIAQIAAIVQAIMAAQPTPVAAAQTSEGFSMGAVEDYLKTRKGFRKKKLEDFIDPSMRPEAFDLKKSCEEKAASLGHKITTWYNADYPAEWMVQFKYDWYAYCDQCGANAFARWTGPARDCPEKSHPEVAWTNRAGGPALQIREVAYLAAKQKRKLPPPYKKAAVS